MRGAALLIPFALLFLALGAGCSEQDEAGLDLDVAMLAVEDVYAGFAKAINRPGDIYQVTITTEMEGESFSAESTVKLWVDAAQDLVREEGTGKTHGEESTVQYEWGRVTVNGTVYKHVVQPEEESKYDTTVEARTCHGVNAAASAVLGCPGWDEDLTTEIAEARYHGQRAVALMASGSLHFEDETTPNTMTLYLDASTFLPIALESEGAFEDPRSLGGFKMRMTFKNRFIAAESIPDDFFDPASIGYVEPSPS